MATVAGMQKIRGPSGKCRVGNEVRKEKGSSWGAETMKGSGSYSRGALGTLRVFIAEAMGLFSFKNNLTGCPENRLQEREAGRPISNDGRPPSARWWEGVRSLGIF